MDSEDQETINNKHSCKNAIAGAFSFIIGLTIIIIIFLIYYDVIHIEITTNKQSIDLVYGLFMGGCFGVGFILLGIIGMTDKNNEK